MSRAELAKLEGLLERVRRNRTARPALAAVPSRAVAPEPEPSSEERAIRAPKPTPMEQALSVELETIEHPEPSIEMEVDEEEVTIDVDEPTSGPEIVLVAEEPEAPTAPIGTRAPEARAPTPVIVRAPEPTRAPTPEPVRAPTPEPVRAPAPAARAPTPEPLRAPTPEPVRAPVARAAEQAPAPTAPEALAIARLANPVQPVARVVPRKPASFGELFARTLALRPR